MNNIINITTNAAKAYLTFSAILGLVYIGLMLFDMLAKGMTAMGY